MKLLDNKVALITGGARGIGEAIVRRFAAQGAIVAFTYVSENSAEKAQKIVNDLTANGATVVALPPVEKYQAPAINAAVNTMNPTTAATTLIDASLASVRRRG